MEMLLLIPFTTNFAVIENISELAVTLPHLPSLVQQTGAEAG
jgi:hypothetical protein